MKFAANNALYQRRLSVLSGIMAVACTFIILRLFFLQIQNTLNLLSQSERNYRRTAPLSAPRGKIFDATGALLATNRPVISICWQGTGKKKLDEHQTAALAVLETITHTSYEQKLPLIVQAERFSKKTILYDDIPFEQLSALVEQFPQHKNITIQVDFKRHYPHEQTACHICGYLTTLAYESSGKMGLEQLFDEALRGIPGQIVTTVNSFGHHLTREYTRHALTGNDLHTTLNLALQKAAEKAFPEHYRGAFIIMNARTGALQVVLSRPTFDPNVFLQPLSHDDWIDIQQTKPFINRAFAACYPPASLFKLITIIAALDQNIIKQDSSWYCSGSTDFAGRPYHCKRRTGHGTLQLQEVIATSCNIPFYEIGKKIKIDTLAHYAHMFGLGNRTTTLLPEKEGLIPTSHWKRTTKQEAWWPGETLSAAIGQSYLLATPLQMCCVVGALCEGFLVTPRLLEDEPIVQQPILINENILSFMREAMRHVVTRGTGKGLNRLQDIKIYAKTGTAQVCALSNQNSAENLEHGWFGAHFTYRNNDPLVMIVIAENVGSSSFAAQIAKDFLREYCKYCDQK